MWWPLLRWFFFYGSILQHIDTVFASTAFGNDWAEACGPDVSTLLYRSKSVTPLGKRLVLHGVALQQTQIAFRYLLLTSVSEDR
jgi:hypothetical protein